MGRRKRDRLEREVAEERRLEIELDRTGGTPAVVVNARQIGGELYVERKVEARTAQLAETIAAQHAANAALEQRLVEKEAEAEAIYWARREADRRTLEARAERDAAEAALLKQERLTEASRQRAEDYLARVRALEATLEQEPAVGVGALWQRRAEQAKDQLASERAKSHARGSALAALQENHRRLKRGDSSKDRRIGYLDREKSRLEAELAVVITERDEARALLASNLAVEVDVALADPRGGTQLDRAYEGERRALDQRNHLRRVVGEVERVAIEGLRDLYRMEPTRLFPRARPSAHEFAHSFESKEEYLARRGWTHVGGPLDEWTRPSVRGVDDPDRVLGIENVYGIQAAEDAPVAERPTLGQGDVIRYVWARESETGRERAVLLKLEGHSWRGEPSRTQWTLSASQVSS